jgi:hypothetical protein
VLRAVVGACLIAGVTVSIAFAACAKGPGSAPPPPVASAVPSQLAPAGDADNVAARAAAAQSCSEPVTVLLNQADGGVMFNNAMTSADAGHLDRGDRVVAALSAQGTRFRCCFDEWMRTQPERKTAEMMLQVLLSPDGRVADAGVDPTRSDVQDTLTTMCVVSVASKVEYPPSPRKVATLIEYPLKVGVEGR